MVAQVKSPLIVAALKVSGFLGKVTCTENYPQIWEDVELETLSYHRAVEEERGTRTEVVMEGNEVAVIVAEEQGSM